MELLGIATARGYLVSLYYISIKSNLCILLLSRWDKPEVRGQSQKVRGCVQFKSPF